MTPTEGRQALLRIGRIELVRRASGLLEGAVPHVVVDLSPTGNQDEDEATATIRLLADTLWRSLTATETPDEGAKR